MLAINMLFHLTQSDGGGCLTVLWLKNYEHWLFGYGGGWQP